MPKNTRLAVGIGFIIALLGIIFMVDNLQRTQPTTPDTSQTESDDGEPEGNGKGNGNGNTSSVEAGAVPIYQNDEQIGSISADVVDNLEKTSFVDDEEGKSQEGWYLRDIFAAVLDADEFTADTVFTISSSTRDKSVDVTWSQIDELENYVMFDVSGRGTLKLVSKTLEDLNQRDEWVQDVDRIDITSTSNE